MFNKNVLLCLLGFFLLAGCTPGTLVNQPALPPVKLEFRYGLPGAGEVTLVWGVNGWLPISEELRTPGTRLIDNIMNTPMNKDGDFFVVRVTVPAWSSIDYGFLITRLADGTTVQPLWDGSEDYLKPVYQRDELVELSAAIDLSQAQALTGPVETAPVLAIPVSREIRFILPDAGEVILVWGINGWFPVPEGMRPDGTVLKDNVMHTVMVKADEMFVAQVRVPGGSTLDYGFLITKTRLGQAVQVWEGGGEDGYHEVINEAGISEVRSGTTLRSDQALPSVMLVGLYLLAGILIILIVGFLFRIRG